jgi:flagellar biosynthesis component FlhA
MTDIPPLLLAAGPDLWHRIGPGGSLPETPALLDALRASLKHELGLDLPPIAAGEAPGLPADAWTLLVGGRPVADGTVPAGAPAVALTAALDAPVRANGAALFQLVGGEPLVLVLGMKFAPLLDMRRGAILLGRLQALQRRWKVERGRELPAFAVRDDDRLPPGAVRLAVGGARAWEATLGADVPVDTAEARDQVAEGIEAAIAEALARQARRLTELGSAITATER